MNFAVSAILHAGECADQVCAAELRALDRIYVQLKPLQNPSQGFTNTDRSEGSFSFTHDNADSRKGQRNHG